MINNIHTQDITYRYYSKKIQNSIDIKYLDFTGKRDKYF